MSSLNTQLTKNMILQLLQIRKNNKNMLFSNTQSTKNMSS